jgi:hypothetical protein
MGIAMLMAPVETPLVDSAEPISKIESVKETPMVENSNAKITSKEINSKIDTITGICSRVGVSRSSS